MKLKKLLKAGTEAGEQENAYVTEHRVSKTFQFSKDFQVEAFKGLLFSQLVTQADGDRKVISHWKNQDSFKASQEPFKAHLNGGRLVSEGFHCEIKTKGSSWWRQISILSVILFITTILGFWKTMNDQYDEWFEPPGLDISAKSKEPFRIVADADGAAEIVLRNQSISTPGLIKEIRCFLVNDRTNRLVQQDTHMVVVEKREKISHSIPFSAAEAGGYLLRVEATFKTGKLRAPRTYTNHFEVQAWPEFAFEPAQVRQFSTNTCRITVNLITGTGSTNSFRCEALLTNNQSVCFSMVAPAQGDPDKYCDDFSKRSQLDWRSAPLGAFQMRTFSLLLESKQPKTGAEWTNLIGRITFTATN